MAITKFRVRPVSNTGSSGGNGMQEMDVRVIKKIMERQADSDLYRQHEGHEVSCPHCGEVYELSSNEYSFEDSLRVILFMRDKRCPFCNVEYSVSKSKKVFRINIGEYEAVHKPLGYKPINLVEYIPE